TTNPATAPTTVVMRFQKNSTTPVTSCDTQENTLPGSEAIQSTIALTISGMIELPTRVSARPQKKSMMPSTSPQIAPQMSRAPLTIVLTIALMRPWKMSTMPMTKSLTPCQSWSRPASAMLQSPVNIPLMAPITVLMRPITILMAPEMILMTP